MDFLKAKIITEIKTLHQKRKLHATYIASKASIKRSDILLKGPDLKKFFHRSPILLLSRMWFSQLFNHNEAPIDLQVGPSSINKQESDTPVTTMFYHFLAPEGGQPI